METSHAVEECPVVSIERSSKTVETVITYLSFPNTAPSSRRRRMANVLERKKQKKKNQREWKKAAVNASGKRGIALFEKSLVGISDLLGRWGESNAQHA